MLAQFMSQLQAGAAAPGGGSGPVAGAAVAAAAVAAAADSPAAEQALDAPLAASDAGARLPGSDEVARIAAEVNAVSPRRPRTISKPEPAPQAPAPLDEPVVAAPEPVVEAPTAEEQAALPAGEDNLEVISGLGPIYAKRLRELGVTTFAQLADAPYDVLYKVTRGNLERVIKEDWRGQARRLAKPQ